MSTPPASSGTLRGITGDTEMQFMADEGLVFHRTGPTREELSTSDELILRDRGGDHPVVEVDGRPIGEGKYPVTRTLPRRYEAATHGKEARYAGRPTLVPTEPPAGAIAPTVRRAARAR